MVNVTFYIDKKNCDKKGFAPIKANVAVNYKVNNETVYKNISKTIEKVKPKHWNKTKQRVYKPKPEEKDNDYERLNNILDNFQSEANVYFKEIKDAGLAITPELVKKLL